MRRLGKIIKWFQLTDLGLPVPAPLVILEVSLVAEAAAVIRAAQAR